MLQTRLEVSQPKRTLLLESDTAGEAVQAAAASGPKAKAPPKPKHVWATEETNTAPKDAEAGEATPDKADKKPVVRKKHSKRNSQFGHHWAIDEDRPGGGYSRRPEGNFEAYEPFLSRERNYSQFGHKWAHDIGADGKPRRPRDKTWKGHWKKKGPDDHGRSWFGDAGVDEGDENPAVYLPAGRQPRDLRPRRAPPGVGVQPPPTSECPALICDPQKLERRGVHTGERFRQWSDRLGSTKGLEDSYKVGPAPQREWRSALGMYDDILGGDDP